MPNQTPPELEQRILEMTEQDPTYSYLRISQQLRLIDVGVSPSAVRCVWARHGLTLRYQQLLWLEQKTAERGGVLTEAQMRLLRRWRGKVTDPDQHIQAPRAGYLLCQDTYFVGTIKGVGRVYQQTVVDAHSSQAFAKLYLSKVPMFYNLGPERMKVSNAELGFVSSNSWDINGAASAGLFTFWIQRSAGEPPEELGFSADRVVSAITDLAPLVRG